MQFSLLVSCTFFNHEIRNLPLFFMLQKDADPSKKDTVVLLLQDMLEVVTRDMMVNEIRLANFLAFLVTVVMVERIKNVNIIT